LLLNTSHSFSAGAARVASHPAKNITEQKMLDSSLYEMSKQRFNFIVQCQWQSKLFLQKQKQKTAVMHDLLRNVDVSILSENPFSIKRKTAPAKRPRKRELLSLKSKSLPEIASPSKKSDQRLTTRGDEVEIAPENVFVTQKFPLIVEDRSDSDAIKRSKLGIHETSQDDDDWMWPIHDIRYIRLSEVLCENYPKIVHLQAKQKTANFVALTTGS